MGFFEKFRGLRQWDPLPPLLFIIVMEAYSKMILGLADGGFLLGAIFG